MGHAIGDWNNDGLMDWFSSAIIDDKTNCEIVGCTFDDGGNKLFQNLGRQQFADITEQVQLKTRLDLSTGSHFEFFDLNCDVNVYCSVFRQEWPTEAGVGAQHSWITITTVTKTSL